MATLEDLATRIAQDVKARALTVHAHDDRYYTEAEVDEKLGGKVDATDARLTDSRVPTAHRHGWVEIDGKPTTFTPAAHTHAVENVTGLASRLTELERDTGPRVMNALVPGWISGDVILQRVGKNVYLTLNELEVTPNNGATTLSLGGFLPSGFRFFPPAYKYFSAFARTANHNRGEIRIDRYGGVDVYNVNGLRTNVSAVWSTSQAYPSTLPGTPG